jgi:choline dehydrogenase-like flavoprotein
VFTIQQPEVRVAHFGAGWLDGFMARVDAVGYARCRMAFVTFHQMATCPIGADPTRGVVDERGESFDLPGLFVADGSAFPTSSGVNPMLTICAIADHVARGIAERGSAAR